LCNVLANAREFNAFRTAFVLAFALRLGLNVAALPLKRMPRFAFGVGPWPANRLPPWTANDRELWKAGRAANRDTAGLPLKRGAAPKWAPPPK
jgi:hypothetical protein